MYLSDSVCMLPRQNIKERKRLSSWYFVVRKVKNGNDSGQMRYGKQTCLTGR